MITPVHIDIKDSQSSMRFEIPADYTRYNLPKPNESFIIFKPRMENISQEFGLVVMPMMRKLKRMLLCKKML